MGAWGVWAVWGVRSGWTAAVNPRGLLSTHLSDPIVLISVTNIASIMLVQVIRVIVTDGSGISVVTDTVVNWPVEVRRSGVLRESVVVGLVDSMLVATRHHACEQTRLLLPLLGDGARTRAVAGGVVIGRGGAKALLLAVVAGESELREEREDEEENGDDGDGETGCLEAAGGAEAGKSSESA